MKDCSVDKCSESELPHMLARQYQHNKHSTEIIGDNDKGRYDFCTERFSCAPFCACILLDFGWYERLIFYRYVYNILVFQDSMNSGNNQEFCYWSYKKWMEMPFEGSDCSTGQGGDQKEIWIAVKNTPSNSWEPEIFFTGIYPKFFNFIHVLKCVKFLFVLCLHAVGFWLHSIHFLISTNILSKKKIVISVHFDHV